METIKKFPYLVVQNKNFTSFDGYITVHDQDYRICVNTSNKAESELHVDWRLQNVAEKEKSLILQRLQQSEDTKTFLTELQSILVKCTQSKMASSTHLLAPTYYQTLFKDIQELGWDKVAFINDDMTEIHLNAKDEANREHVLQLKFSSQQNAPVVIQVDLPVQFESSNKHIGQFRSIYQEFCNHLAKYQMFWDQMDEIDQNTWVLEPTKPMRKDTYRRIVVDNSLSVQITVDPFNLGAIPEFCFLGSDIAISRLRETINTNSDKWNPNSMLMQNLKDIGMEFPSRQLTKKEEFTIQCGICYSYQLNDLIPDKTCDDSRCGQPFHCVCLYEWLKGLTASRQSFNIIFGACPYCSKSISCKMPTVNQMKSLN